MKFLKIVGGFAIGAIVFWGLYTHFSTSKLDIKSIFESNESLDVKIPKMRAAIEKEYTKINKVMFEVRQERTKLTPRNSGLIVEKIKIAIQEMLQIDQSLRNLMCSIPNEEEQLRLYQEIISNIDIKNTMNLKELLSFSKTGWVTISEFGIVCDTNAWLLVQHADHDPNFQSKILSILDNLVKSEETSKINYAYLYDRVAVSAGKLQRYGTQTYITNGILQPDPTEDVENLDKRRISLGLDTMESYIKILEELNAPLLKKKSTLAP